MTPSFKTRLLAQIQIAQKSGQSEAVAIADWLDGLVEEPDMDEELVLSGLDELITWATEIRKALATQG
jgi:hypothetical protein